jgi:two-component system response regulator HydG
VVLSRGSAIEIDDLPPEVRSGGAAVGDGRTLSFVVGTPLEEIERRVIHATLAHVGGDKRLCAQLLGIATRTIYRRLEEERGGTEEPASEAEPESSNVPNWQRSSVGGAG